MSAPPPDPDPRPYGTCPCGNELPEPALSIHRRLCGIARREEVSTMPGGSDASFEKAKQDQADFAKKLADARRNGADKS